MLIGFWTYADRDKKSGRSKNRAKESASEACDSIKSKIHD